MSELVVLVCGGRMYGIVPYNTPPEQLEAAATKADRERAALHTALAQLGPDRLIHGAANGADSIAWQWASSQGIPSHPFHANWSRFGAGAGPLRNRDMARCLLACEEHGARVLVLATPGGAGTASMKSIATRFGLEIQEVQL